MNLNFVERDGLTLAVIDGYFTAEELPAVKKELAFLNNPYFFKRYTNRVVATAEEDNSKLQKSFSFFLDPIYEEHRQDSAILTANRKIFLPELVKPLIAKNAFFSHIIGSNCDTTLVNYYTADCYYKAHRDSCPFTALTFIELEKFVGGELYFPEYDVTIEPLDNRTVIFPGSVLHAAKEVFSGVRVSLAHFIAYADNA